MSNSGLVVNKVTYTGVLVLEFVSEWKSFLSENQYSSHYLVYFSELSSLASNIGYFSEWPTFAYDDYSWETLRYGMESLRFKYPDVARVTETKDDGDWTDEFSTDPSFYSKAIEAQALGLLRLESVRSALRANMTLDARSSEVKQLSSKTSSSHNTTSDSNAAAQVGYYAAGGVAGMVALALL
ncbi:hypothetical protein C7M61_003814 [Candidozyma pseudohaemuli]|uniref:Uncharacterized protein n=1 Tax=Candidozyma pseudohaemuli TaxID=418784 RepID=A0A2P7YLW9_9ASCO|nr:hypothetical protein C7M61_003814 [[Candida] pseudohaemulonii]PSK36949.1 hypothetical protein C7M61_003814 [[Candida] pseudohaemulonii]